MNTKKTKVSKSKKALHIADVSKSACLCEFSDRFWDKNGSKCLKCGKHFS